MILACYDTTDVSYRQQFRSSIRRKEESNWELLARLLNLATKWMQGCDAKADLMDRLVNEQLINTLPPEVRVAVKERRPKTAEEAAQLADDYLQARKVTDGHEDARPPPDRQTKWCQKCKKPGHLTKDCQGTPRVKAANVPDNPVQRPKGNDRPKKDI